MAIDKPLTAFFGAGATQTATQVTFLKADLVSTRTPIGFIGLSPQAVNTAESIIGALMNKFNEEQDTSGDAQFAIFPQGVSVIRQVSDGIEKPFLQYLYTVRILTPLANEAPNPNLI
jgi:hypothetical protein